MKTMSAIYQKVRHRLNDDWAYGNGEKSTEKFSRNYIIVEITANIYETIYCHLRTKIFI